MYLGWNLTQCPESISKGLNIKHIVNGQFRRKRPGATEELKPGATGQGGVVREEHRTLQWLVVRLGSRVGGQFAGRGTQQVCNYRAYHMIWFVMRESVWGHFAMRTLTVECRTAVAVGRVQDDKT